jgi:hypothetical protein
LGVHDEDGDKDEPFMTTNVLHCIASRSAAAPRLRVPISTYAATLFESSFLDILYKELHARKAVPLGVKSFGLPKVLEHLRNDMRNQYYPPVKDKEEKANLKEYIDWYDYALCVIEKRIATHPRGLLHLSKLSKRRQFEWSWIIWKAFCNLKMTQHGKLDK